MKKHLISKINEVYYTHKLANGLEVTIFHKPDFNNSFFAFGTPFGSFCKKQQYINSEYSFHAGIAHFLEHKLFEDENQDILNQFATLGCNANAFTSYKQTVYYFQTSNQEIEKPLNLLLDFVQKINISDKSVEKEKGIIIEELNMYNGRYDSRLLNEMYKSLYHKFPIKDDIGGDETSVRSINKIELELCHELNYHPSNMQLVIASGVDPKTLIDIIENNQNNKNFSKKDKVYTTYEKEPLGVVREEYEFAMDIKSNKYAFAIKIKPEFTSELDAAIKEYMVDTYLECYFSFKNPAFQRWYDKEYINELFDYYVDFDKDHACIFFINENIDADFKIVSKFKRLIINELSKPCFSKELFNQLKNKSFANYLRKFNDLDNLALTYIKHKLSGNDMFEYYNKIQKLSFEEVKDYFETLRFTKNTLVLVKAK